MNNLNKDLRPHTLFSKAIFNAGAEHLAEAQKALEQGNNADTETHLKQAFEGLYAGMVTKNPELTAELINPNTRSTTPMYTIEGVFPGGEVTRMKIVANMQRISFESSKTNPSTGEQVDFGDEYIHLTMPSQNTQSFWDEVNRLKE